MPLSRRGFLKAGGITVASLTALALGLHSVDESQDPVVDKISFPIKALHPALDGFTIVQMTDIHLRPYTQARLVRRAVTMANQLNPDLVVLTGDYVWRVREAAYEIAPLLASLNAKYGVYSVLGNHDYWLDLSALQSSFKASGLPILYNQGLSIRVGNAILYLAGVDDAWSGRPDLSQALAEAPGGVPVILLLHEPDTADNTLRDPRISLQLSGHTHGGQVIIPGRPPFVHPYLGEKYPAGLYKVQNAWLYTNRGIGCTTVPIRINCPPEITQFTLVPL